MVPADVGAVMAIELDTFTLPWTPQAFGTLAERESAICLICEQDGEPVGYLVAEMFVDVWHIMNLAVASDRRREHIAADLLEAYFEIAESAPHRGHTLEVRISNEPAIELYRTYGFIATGVRRGYYSDNREDALIMWRDWEGASA
jgi:[ribosomal protein S18]-alanine N-acetyltransferase